MADKFAGFLPPTENYSKLPHQMIEALPLVETVSELKVILYVLRHTWGFQEFDELKRITLDEFQHGRKKQDGSRLDAGTGLSANAIKDGIRRAVKHGFLIQVSDGRDFGRSSHAYQLRVSESDTVSESDNQPSKLDSQPSSSDSQPSKPDTRSEKETPERNPRKKRKKESPAVSEKPKEQTDEEIVADVIEQTKTHKDIFDLSLETVTEREKAGGNYADPASAGGADAAAEAALVAMYGALGSEPPRRDSASWKSELGIISRVLRDRDVRDVVTARSAGWHFGLDNREAPQFANIHLSTFPSSFGVYVGKAKKQTQNAASRRDRLDADNVEAQAAFEERRASRSPQVKSDPVWEQAKREIALQMTRATFDTWVRRTYGLGRADGVYTVVAPDALTRDWLDSRLKTTAERTLVGILGEAVEVRFEVADG